MGVKLTSSIQCKQMRIYDHDQEENTVGTSSAPFEWYILLLKGCWNLSILASTFLPTSPGLLTSIEFVRWQGNW